MLALILSVTICKSQEIQVVKELQGDQIPQGKLNSLLDWFHFGGSLSTIICEGHQFLNFSANTTVLKRFSFPPHYDVRGEF